MYTYLFIHIKNRYRNIQLIIIKKKNIFILIHVLLNYILSTTNKDKVFNIK